MIVGTFVGLVVAGDQEIHQCGWGKEVAVEMKQPCSGTPGLDLLEIVMASIQMGWMSAGTDSDSVAEEEIPWTERTGAVRLEAGYLAYQMDLRFASWVPCVVYGLSSTQQMDSGGSLIERRVQRCQQ